MKRAFFFIALAATASFAAQAATEPLAEPATQARSKRKAAKPQTPPPCLLDARANACGFSGGAPNQLQLNGKDARAEGPKTKLIFDGPPKHPLPFENDLSPQKKTPVGGLMGLEFPF